MDYLFNIPLGAKTIGETDFKMHYAQVNKNMDIDPFMVEMRKVTRDIIIPQVTEEFYVDLSTKFQSGIMSEAEFKVLELLKDAIAEYTIWGMSPKHNLGIGDLGLVERHGSEGQSNAVSQWRYKHFYWKLMVQADKHLDMALTYLDENAADFFTFSSNRAKLRLNDFLVRSTKDFEQFVHLNGSRRTFRKLIPGMLQANQRFIYPILSKAFHNELLEELREDTLTEANEAILIHVQEVICQYGLLHSIPHLAVMIEDDGIFVLSSTDGMNTKQLAHESRLQDLKERLNEDAIQAVKFLKNFLYEHQEEYPTWKNSSAFEAIESAAGYPLNLKGGVFLG